VHHLFYFLPSTEKAVNTVEVVSVRPTSEIHEPLLKESIVGGVIRAELPAQPSYISGPLERPGLACLCHYGHLFHGLTNRSLRTLIAELIPGYSTGQATYDLRRVRISAATLSTGGVPVGC